MRSITRTAAALAVVGLASLGLASSAQAYTSDTTVPGQQGRDGTVTGHYTESQFGCDYVVNYRGDFGGDAYLDDGWIMNQITCDDGWQGTYLIVNESDPRYTGNPDRAIWGSWEIVKQTVKGEGNLANIHAPYYDPSLVG